MSDGLWSKIEKWSRDLSEKFRAWSLGDEYLRMAADEAEMNREEWWARPVRPNAESIMKEEDQAGGNETLVRRHAIVAGLVQHVGFRWSAGYQATRLELTGWIKNLPTSEVEVEFQGTPANVAAMTSWLHHGPRGANVTKVLLDNIKTVEGEKQFRMEY